MQYQTILADPPWQTKAGRPLGIYKKVDGKQIFKGASNKSRDLNYSTMSVDAICELGSSIKPYISDNAHLYIWVTNQFLPKIEQVVNAWGFAYSTTLVWCKTPMGGGLGGAFKISTEFLIFARKGSLKAKGMNIGTWFDQKRQYVDGHPCHSKKPHYFYELIEKISPGPYLELFAREKRNNWGAWGNQVESTIEL